MWHNLGVGGKTGAGRLPPPLAGFPRYRLRLIYLSCSLCWFTCGRLDWNRSISSGDIPYSSSSSSSSSRSMRLRFNPFPTPPADTRPPVNFLSQLAPFSFLFPSSWNLAPWLWLSLQHPLYVPGRINVWTKWKFKINLPKRGWLGKVSSFKIGSFLVATLWPLILPH